MVLGCNRQEPKPLPKRSRSSVLGAHQRPFGHTELRYDKVSVALSGGIQASLRGRHASLDVTSSPKQRE